MVRLPDAPFVLLDDARPGGGARLYARPVEIVTGDVAAGLARLREAQAAGLHAAGFLSYEGAETLEPRAWAAPAAEAGPRLWFGLFEEYAPVADAAALLPDPAGAWAGAPEPRIARREYFARLARVAEYIAAGDIYQANLTFQSDVRWAGDPAALYALVRGRAAAGYGALVHTGERWLLSFSPELFFRMDGSRITAEPMKGTAVRLDDPAADARAALALREDPKQRAENLMIVDLMRNDLSRVARAGSVAVPRLFHVEQYPTVHQMISTITADLAEGVGAADALAVLFPCGSVTGAPKVRAMQIIEEVERAPRGVYTGAIGRLDANGDALFNVAIRTLAIDPAGRASMGLGSGLVADSRAEEEWDECLAKGAFLTAGEKPFDLIETMGFEPEQGIVLLDRHLARMKASADAFGFSFDRHMVRNELQAATFRLHAPARIRLLLAASGAIAIGIAPMPPRRAGPMRAAIAPLPVAASDFRLRHKTSRRGFYDAARGAGGADEVVFVDAEGFLTEGSFTSLFVEREGVLVTPPLARGLLPGVLRAELLESGRAVEGDLVPGDLAGGFWLGNALRGLVAAVTVAETERAAV
ncbi:aminodeoxychorismate synthase component I [Sphingomonas canadensis]|uniref:Probable branched-chain-amino-acid aminotransferase n=1 Tax=Sphingomonas canadensis TaxID=1219257 RepID=A0ABW3H1M0_9SPHN|nr:aminodeoxychorismate synthase component I [Sphingomonas canadensis]MCW3834747.1 aminodeoxychorismate synthase component I [Sphingomonas canadensis]